MIDWTSIINTFVATLPLTITAIGGLLAVLYKVEQIHRATNSMKDALVATTRSDALQEGHTAGVAEEKATAKKLKGKP